MLIYHENKGANTLPASEHAKLRKQYIGRTLKAINIFCDRAHELNGKVFPIVEVDDLGDMIVEVFNGDHVTIMDGIDEFDILPIPKKKTA